MLFKLSMKLSVLLPGVCLAVSALPGHRPLQVAPSPAVDSSFSASSATLAVTCGVSSMEPSLNPGGPLKHKH